MSGSFRPPEDELPAMQRAEKHLDDFVSSIPLEARQDVLLRRPDPQLALLKSIDRKLDKVLELLEKKQS